MSTSAQRFVVGDRVRVRQGGGQAPPCDELPHSPDEQGHTGAVVAVRAQPGAPHHPYLVKLDRPFPEAMWCGASISIAARHYAADELEPIS